MSPAKLDWFNQQWLRLIADKEPKRVLDPIKSRLSQLHPNQPLQDSHIKNIVHLLKDRATFPVDIADWSDYFFNEPNITRSNPHLAALWKLDHSPKMVASFLQQVSGELDFEATKLQQIMKKTSQELGISIGELYKPLRFLLTGTVVGAAVPQTMQVLGREESLKRLSKYNQV